MYTFTFRISQNKNTFARIYAEVTVQAPDYYEKATITKTNGGFPWLKRISCFWPMAVMPPCRRSFSFDDPFSPWQLYYAVKNGDLYFEVETDYPGDLTKEPPMEEKKSRWVLDEETGDYILLPPDDLYVLY